MADIQSGLRKAFNTTDSNNTYQPEKSFLDKAKAAVGMEPDPMKRKLKQLEQQMPVQEDK